MSDPTDKHDETSVDSTDQTPTDKNDESETTCSRSEADTIPEGDPIKVAIACQGGGSHTAFTAGVLSAWLDAWDERYELVGISGTSGGAFNALTVWYGLVTEGPEQARENLEALWADLAAASPVDRLTNEWLVSVSTFESSGAPVPTLSPYFVPSTAWGEAKLRRILDRHVPFDDVPDLCSYSTPELVIGTVDVNGGCFETFTNEDVTIDAALASAAIPTLFEAVEINGHYHWDGLFSQNPPVDDLLTVPADRKPDELWIVQINPQQFEGEPRTLDVISDRRNELSGNISLNQELRFVKRVNEWIEEGYLPESKFSQVEIRRLEMPGRLPVATKLDRSPSFIEDRFERGTEAAEEFLEELPH